MSKVDPGATGSLRIAPSVLSANFGALSDAAREVDPETDWLHVDIMDGHFVPNLTIGPAVVASLRPHSTRFFDCHLMMTNPGGFLESFADAGADGCTVHVEVGTTSELIRRMRSLGLRVGLAVNPETPLSEAVPYLDAIDLLLLMTVHPGFGGQSFIGSVMAKVAAARESIIRHGFAVDVEVDGGIDVTTAPVAVAAGANVLVAGSAVFARPSPLEAARALRRAASASNQ